MPFVGGLFVSGLLLLGGLLGFQTAGGGGEAATNPNLGWKERQALCQTAAIVKDQLVCELVNEPDSITTP